MAPPLTVQAVRSEERDRLKAAAGALARELARSDEGAADLRSTVDGVITTVAGLQKAELGLRAGIAAALMPADKHQLELDLEANLLLQRPRLADLAAAQDRLALAERTRQSVSARLDTVRAQLAQAEAALVLAEQDHDDATGWREALAGPVRDAWAAAGGQETARVAAAARVHLGTLLGGSALVDLLAVRLRDALSESDERRSAAARATDALDALRAVLAPHEGEVLRTGTALARVRAEVRDAVELGPQRVAAVLHSLGSAVAAPVHSAAVAARLTERAAAALAGAPSPVQKEHDLCEARIVLREARADLEARALVAEATDPGFDRASDPALAAERQRVAAAEAAYRQRLAAIGAADDAAVDGWEVAVPPDTLALAVDTLRALAEVDKHQEAPGGGDVEGDGGVPADGDDGAPEDAAPEDDGAPEDAAPEDGHAPVEGTPVEAAPVEGTPVDEAAPVEGTPVEAAPEDDGAAAAAAATADLLRRLDEAEDDYARALRAALRARAREDGFAVLLARRLDAEAALAPVSDLRVLAAVRGDQ